MKLIKNLDLFSFQHASAIFNCLCDRLDWLDEREPESDGIVYDKWEETRSELQDIVDQFEEVIDIEENEISIDVFQEAIDNLRNYQIEYGGLGRLEVVI